MVRGGGAEGEWTEGEVGGGLGRLIVPCMDYVPSPILTDSSHRLFPETVDGSRQERYRNLIEPHGK